jgi:hypothetical protein
MAIYTTELKNIKTFFDNAMTSYPIFNADYRTVLNEKIYNHYKFREIGLETPGLFADRLAVRMNEIMPLYNQYYGSVGLIEKPLEDIHYNRENNRTGDSNSSGNVDRTGTVGSVDTGYRLHHDTPQGSLEQLETLKYLTDAQKTTGNSTTTNNLHNATAGNIHTTDHFVDEYYGRSGNASQAKMLLEYRKTFMNIDLQIIDNLADLFIMIYN